MAITWDGKDRTRRMNEVAYIHAASHSGSTLLAMLLAAHPDACTVGELKATSLGNVDQYRCSCGEFIKKCPFWKNVTEGMERRGFDFDVTNAGMDIRSGANRFELRLLQPLHRGPVLEAVRDTALTFSPTWRRKHTDIQARNAALVETVQEISGVRIVVDSSKIGIRLKYLLRNKKLKVRVVRLVRDGRAVALTYVDPVTFANAKDPKVRTKHPPLQLDFAEAVDRWRRSNMESDALLAGLDRSQWAQVRYEDYCRDPDAELRRLRLFLGLDPDQAFSDFREREHHIVGNAMRMDTTSEITLDERWRTTLTKEQLNTFENLAGNLNRQYGYE
jgi:hypothetical protein